MPRAKKKRKVYFDEDVQNGIIEYNSCDDVVEKNKIYNERIAYAFNKLAENIINTFKFSYFDSGFEDVKTEVVSFLIMNMHKYDHSKGSKAFSYFSVVAKNYLILHNNNNYKKLKIHDDVSTLEKHKYLDTSGKGYMNDFIEEIITYFENKIPTLFKKKKDIDIAYAVIELLKRRNEIENFNKKSLYILIREMTNENTTRITKVMNVFRKFYPKLINDFETKGILDVDDRTKIKFF
tara:strand:+ start:82 stop:789 length:708 start_codon:yes stop_codon:yes gene_type:complete